MAIIEVPQSIQEDSFSKLIDEIEKMRKEAGSVAVYLALTDVILLIKDTEKMLIDSSMK